MSDVHEDDGEFISASIFEEPEDFRPPPPSSHFVKYERLSIDMKTGQDKRDEMLKSKPGPKEITLRLIGSSPLWGHLLWNAGKYTANYIDLHPELVQGKKVLELGAAGGLPSLICALNQPQKVVCTDYPDAELIENIRINFAELHKQDSSSFNKDNVSVQGYIWGNDYSDVQSFIRQSPTEENPKFDLIILSDLVFNHTEHHKLLQTCKDLVDPNSGKCLVVFSPHRPWLLNDDLSFFELAQTEPYGFKIEKNDLVNWKPMFEEDPETVEVRSRVYSFWLTPNWS